MNFTFAQMNPDFSGAYLAIAGGDITTTKLFDNKSELYSWIIKKIEVQGFEYVETTVIGGNGEVDDRLLTKCSLWRSSENCYKYGPIEPECGESIYVVDNTPLAIA